MVDTLSAPFLLNRGISGNISESARRRGDDDEDEAQSVRVVRPEQNLDLRGIEARVRFVV